MDKLDYFDKKISIDIHLSDLYHIRPDYFNSYNDLCNLIEYNCQEFELYDSGILNSSGIFI